MLNHKNSCHRDFVLTIIANLTAVDESNRFEIIEGDYFACINDEKFSTGQCCVRNCKKVYKFKPEQRDNIILLLLKVDNLCEYPEKQLGLLKIDILKLFEKFYEGIREKDRIDEFVRAQVDSLSPRTRQKSKDFTNIYNLVATFPGN